MENNITYMLFDLTKNNISSIGIFKTYAGDSCYIAKVNNKSEIYDSFILRNGPKAQTQCNISFFTSSISGKFLPRLKFRIVHTETEIVKETKNKDVIISFEQTKDGSEEFWKMISFLSKFKELVDMGDFDRTYRAIDSNSYIVEFKTKNEAEQVKELGKIIKDSGLSEDAVKKAFNDNRKISLIEFEKMLNEFNYISTYKSKNSITKQGEEPAWHHFLKKNSWILGLSVDIRFINDFYSEQNIGIPSTDNKGSPHVDMMGIRDYTVLVELKTSETKIFSDKKKNTSRTNTWSFSDEFLDGISQCLAQKFDWDKTHDSKDLTDPETNQIMSQDEIRTVDPKTLFIIGNKSKEMPQKLRNTENYCKRDTFERFRRNNRNLEISTFDELYERAYFIVNGVQLENK